MLQPATQSHRPSQQPPHSIVVSRAIFPLNIVIRVSVALASDCTIKDAVGAGEEADHEEKKCAEPVCRVVSLRAEQLCVAFLTSTTRFCASPAPAAAAYDARHVRAASVFLCWHFAHGAAFANAGYCFLAYNLFLGWQRARVSCMRIAVLKAILVTTSFANDRRKRF